MSRSRSSNSKPEDFSASRAFPSPKRQTTYFATGALAGACTTPIVPLWSLVSRNKPAFIVPRLLKTAPALMGRAGVRFWIFDITNARLQISSANTFPIWLKGGISGATGGAAEICAQSLMQRRLPLAKELTSQSSKLFFCFSTYTYLSTTFSDDLPPRPFWYCWTMGAAAGGLGTAIIARVEGFKGIQLWKNAVPKGMLTIGTVIAVQVTSCAEFLNRAKV